MLSQKIGITALSSISALGHDSRKVWEQYCLSSHLAIKKDFGGDINWVVPISEEIEKEIEDLRQENGHYRGLDRSVLFALLVSRTAMEMAGWESTDDFGVNFGSSRGATGLFEKYHQWLAAESCR